MPDHLSGMRVDTLKVDFPYDRFGLRPAGRTAELWGHFGPRRPAPPRWLAGLGWAGLGWLAGLAGLAGLAELAG